MRKELIVYSVITSIKSWLVNFGSFICFFPGSSSPASATTCPDNSSLQQKVEAFDQYFTELNHWLLSVYDVKTGGFWESIEEKEKLFEWPLFWVERRPRLESTARAVNIMYAMDTLQGLSPEVRQKIITYIQGFQNKEGWFDDPLEKRSRKSRLGRGLVYGVSSLKKLGGEPIYPVPTQNANDNSADLSHLRDSSSLRRWFNAVTLEKQAWQAGSVIQDQYVLIDALPSVKRQELFSELFSLFEANQYPDGYWWEGKPYDRLSGSYKISTYYKKLRRPMPKASHIFHSTLRVMKSQSVDNASVIRNAITFLNTVLPQLQGKITFREKCDAVELTIKNSVFLKRTDGGFAQRPSDPWSATDGVSHAIKARRQLRLFVGLDPKPLAGSINLNELLQSALDSAR